MPDSNDGSPARAEVRTSIAVQPVAPPPAPVSRCRQAQLRHIPLASQAAGSALSRTELSRPSPVSRTEPLRPGPASRRLSRSIEAPFVQDFELSEPSFISQSKKDRILNFPNEKHPLQAHIVQEIELSESEVAIPRAIPFGKFKILHQAPLQRRVNSYVEQRNIQQSQPHTPASHPSRPNFAASTFAPLLLPLLLPLLPSLPFVPISTFAPSLRLCFYPCLHYRFRLPSLLSRPRLRLCPSPPCAFISAFAPALRPPPPPQHRQESPASPPGNAGLNSRPKAIIPSPSERLSPRSPGRARGPSSTPEQPLDCPLFRQFR